MRDVALDALARCPPGLPVVCVGHSLGAAMALKHAGAGDVRVFAMEGEGGHTAGAHHEVKNSAWGLGLDNLVYLFDWNDHGKARVSDLFRRIDRSHTGNVPRNVFIDAIIASSRFSY